MGSKLVRLALKISISRAKSQELRGWGVETLEIFGAWRQASSKRVKKIKKKDPRRILKALGEILGIMKNFRLACDTYKQ